MRKIYYLLLICLVFFSCQKEDILHTISISGISTDSVSVGDTLEVYIDWENSDFSEYIVVSIYGEVQQVLGFKNDTTFLIEITHQVEEISCIYLKHPNGAEGSWCSFYKVDNPRINNISTLTGKGGDKITISGIDFLSGDSIAVKINAMHCEIESINDTSITFIVPNGCGNGKVKIIYWPDYAGCTPDREIEAGLFKYNFSGIKTDYLIKSYTFRGIEYSIERDNLKRVNKRTILSDYEIVLSGEYELFIYGSDGYIDTLKHYSSRGLEYYLVYDRNNDNTILEISQFDNDGFRQKQELHYLNGKIVQYNSYISTSDGVLQGFSNQYDYSDDKLKVERINFNRDGSASSMTEYNYMLDIYNNGLPDIGAPGFIDQYEDKAYPYTKQHASYSTIVYDEFGRLVSWDETNSYCEPFNKKNICKYEYE